MSSGNLSYVIGHAKFCNNISSEEIACSSRTHGPPIDFFGITPHQVAHCSVVRHLLLPVNGFDLIQGVKRWRQTAMNAKNSVVYYRSQGQKVKDFCAVPPNIY